MLCLFILPLLLLPISSSPLLGELEEVERREASLEEREVLLEGREALLEVQLLDTLEQEERLLDVEGELGEAKEISYTNAGDYTLVSVPWARGAALNFNDSAASTLSTVGNAALLLGGLYLLSGFPAAAALADPFGFSKRLGAASLPRGPINFQHRSSSGEEAFVKKSKMEKMKRPMNKKKHPSQFKHVASFLRTSPPQQKQVNRQGAANSPSKAAKGGPKEHRASERQQRPRFQLPRLPTLRMPQLPRLRNFPNIRMPNINNPFSRPSRPTSSRPASQGSAPARRPAAQQSSTPAAPPAAPVFRPSSFNQSPSSFTSFSQGSPFGQSSPAPQAPPAPAAPAAPAPRPSSARPAAPQPAAPAAPRPAAPVAPQQSEQLRRPAPADTPNIPAADFSPFAGGADPFAEFQSGFGPDEASFRNLINNQFGSSFDSQRLPSRRR